MSIDLTPSMGSTYIQDAFQSIYQIDLVPTISILLGLPIPYANLGGIVPSLLGFQGVSETAAALALNAAQVWRYFTVYSETANKLPNLPELKEQLDEAIVVYKQALAQQKEQANDSTAFYKACGLFKAFLVEAADLGHKVWTRFDTFGMICGGSVLFFTLIIWAMAVYFSAGNIRLPRNQYLENVLSAVFVFFQSGMLSFSNSYIEAEQRIVMFMLELIGLALFVRMNSVTAGGNARIVPYIPLLVPLLSRIAELTISGHGTDPSLRQHFAHNPFIFISSLTVLMGLRIFFYTSISKKSKTGLFHTLIDCITLVFLLISWMEKQSLDQSKNGYFAAKIAITLLIGSLPVALAEALGPVVRNALTSSAEEKIDTNFTTTNTNFRQITLIRALTVTFQLLIGLMVVTGPSTAPTVLIASLQGWMLYILAGATGFYEVSTPVQATLWRLLVRHTFFATNHGCAFNRLQYSAAFVATMEFNFALGGFQLFLNTFGWEMIGLIMVWITSYMNNRSCLWTWYGFYQVMESFLNCISVSLLRRHLMVWAIYAPRFLFSSVFLILNCVGQVVVYILSITQ